MVNQKTLEAYRTASLEYIEKGEDVTKAEYAKKVPLTNRLRTITEMQRFRDVDGAEYILYEQDIFGMSEFTKREFNWHESKEETSMWREPIPEKRYDIDPETEQQKITTVGVKREIIHYDIPFTKENAEKLKPYCNRTTEFNARDGVGAYPRKVNTYEDWINRPIDELVAGYYNLAPETVKNIKKAQQIRE